jgi:hypothetical protein
MNELPDIARDPKFVKLPFTTDRFIAYKPTSLEQHYKHVVLADARSAIPIECIDSRVYEPVPDVRLPDEDRRLLKAPNIQLSKRKYVQPHTDHRSVRLACYRHELSIDTLALVWRLYRAEPSNVRWLRKNEYMTGDFSEETLLVRSNSTSGNKHAMLQQRV